MEGWKFFEKDGKYYVEIPKKGIIEVELETYFELLYDYHLQSKGLSRSNRVIK